ncbi:MAG: AAA family ATPase, partial [Candidatus Sericytochromatia bacterium]
MDPRHLPTRYALDSEIGCGPEGRHYRAFDTEAGAPCRVTIAHGPEAQLWLRRHYVAQARLAHPHVAAGLGEGAVGGGWYAVREWAAPAVSGDPSTLLAMTPGWLKGLGRLHEAGLVHGAIRPAVLGVESGRAKLADVGKLWRIGQSVAADARGQAPEIVAGARVDGRTDLHLFGLALSALLGEAVSLLAPAWAELLARLTAASPRDRFESAAAALAFLGDAPATTTVRRATPFIGRRAELAALGELADTVEAEAIVRAIAVVGEAGVGKTRLLEELRTRLLGRGFDVVCARASARGPWSAWAALMPALLDRVDPVASAPLLPVLAALDPTIPHASAPALEPKAARARLFRAYATLIEEAARAPGLAVVLDDWHAADAESRALYDYLQRALPAVPVMFVLAGQEPPQDGTETLPLGRFGQGEVRALCRGLWDGRDPGGGAGLIEDATGGHPALVEEVAMECALAVAAGAKPTAAARAQLSGARSHQAMWSARLQARSTAARRIATAAAVAGPQAAMPLLAAIAGQSEEVFLGALEELADAGVLQADGDGYSLTAPASALPETPGAAHHARALGYWQAAAGLGAPVRSSLLAHHALQAGDAIAGAHYALAAAEEALSLFALEEARRMLDAAERCMKAMPETPVAHRLALTAMRADMARYLGQGIEAEAEYREAIVLAGAQAPARLPELTVSLGIALGLQARSEEAADCFREVIEAPEAPDAVRSRAMTALARLCVRLGDVATATALCEAALDAPTTPSRHRGEALGLLGLILTTAETPRPVEGLRHLEEATAIAEATGDRLALT